jgi:hypothetical protein
MPRTRQTSPAPGRAAAVPPGRPGPLVVNLPEAKVDTTTGPAPAPADSPDLRLPHERDQTGVDATADAPDPVIVQAAQDLADGQVDTDLRNPGGLDDARRRQLLRKAR